MYVVEMRFTFGEAAVPPSREVLEECVRHNGGGDGRRIEHLKITWVRGDAHIVAFVLTNDAIDADVLAQQLGNGVSSAFRQAHFADYRVWRDGDLGHANERATEIE